MSRLAKKPIELPEGVEVKVVNGEKVLVSGPLGKLEIPLHPLVKVTVKDKSVSTSISNLKDRTEKAMWGTMFALIRNAVKGVSQGFEKKLEVVGTGYRASADKTKLTLNIGFSHPVVLPIPSGLTVAVEKNTIIIKGIDKQAVGQFASIVRSQRPPEPYKGKGIKYSDEIIRRKAGKVMKAAGT